MRCDQCEMLSINGVPCHETGCPNANKEWVEAFGRWTRFVECSECGDEVEEGETCSCQEPVMERMYCVECGAELEEGQSGLCDDCQEGEN